MQVKDVMSKNPDTVSKEMTIKQAAEEMKQNDFGFLPIKHDGEIVGVVTDRDLVIRTLAKGQDPNTATVKDAMTSDILSCYEDDDLNKAAELMCGRQINRLAVYDRQKNLTGVVSMGDIARNCKDSDLLTKLTKEIHKK